MKDCKNCKVKKWFADMFGVCICKTDCPYKEANK